MLTSSIKESVETPRYTRIKGDMRVNLLDAQVGKPYVIAEIRTSDPDMDSFLFRLGAYSGETISIVSKKRKACIVVIKNGRYSLDNLLAEAIVVTEE